LDILDVMQLYFIQYRGHSTIPCISFLTLFFATAGFMRIVENYSPSESADELINMGSKSIFRYFTVRIQISFIRRTVCSQA
jgi:hypothetical protein